MESERSQLAKAANAKVATGHAMLGDRLVLVRFTCNSMIGKDIPIQLRIPFHNGFGLRWLRFMQRCMLTRQTANLDVFHLKNACGVVI